MDKYNPEFIDSEGREIIESNGEINPGSLRKPSENLNRQLKASAREFHKKHETKMNIRIDPEEIELIKQRAATEGLLYSTSNRNGITNYFPGGRPTANEGVFI